MYNICGVAVSVSACVSLFMGGSDTLPTSSRTALQADSCDLLKHSAAQYCRRYKIDNDYNH